MQENPLNVTSWCYLPRRHDVTSMLYNEIRREEKPEEKEMTTHNIAESVSTYIKKKYW